MALNRMNAAKGTLSSNLAIIYLSPFCLLIIYLPTYHLSTYPQPHERGQRCVDLPMNLTSYVSVYLFIYLSPYYGSSDLPAYLSANQPDSLSTLT